MKLILSVVFAAAVLGNSARADIQNFDHTPVGALPAGWLAGVTGKGNPKWAVVHDYKALSESNVLKQSGEGAFPWCVNTKAIIKNGFVEVKFKPVGGKEDQAGGVVWRFQDPDNYYVARANALEDNVTIYHVIKGVRTEKGRAAIKVLPNKWHHLRVDFHATKFVVTLDGAQMLEWNDDLIKDAGAVGVWTKADSVTLFDDFESGGK